jgi:hypothetical protein
MTVASPSPPRGSKQRSGGRQSVRKPSVKANSQHGAHASKTEKQDDSRDAETAPCSPYEQLSCLEALPTSHSVRSKRKGKSFPREKLQHDSHQRVTAERPTVEIAAALPVERKLSAERSLPWESLLPHSADSKLLAKKVSITLSRIYTINNTRQTAKLYKAKNAKLPADGPAHSLFSQTRSS